MKNRLFILICFYVICLFLIIWTALFSFYDFNCPSRKIYSPYNKA
ncbi:hypothetical protein Bateq7PJ16_1956 [Bacillus subtilis]|nr:hypothetical protein Bateq7PJ16_1956 [Bacillus subtilis]